jgi:hypothetical protein
MYVFKQFFNSCYHDKYATLVTYENDNIPQYEDIPENLLVRWHR